MAKSSQLPRFEVSFTNLLEEEKTFGRAVTHISENHLSPRREPLYFDHWCLWNRDVFEKSDFHKIIQKWYLEHQKEVTCNFKNMTQFVYEVMMLYFELYHKNKTTKELEDRIIAELESMVLLDENG